MQSTFYVVRNDGADSWQLCGQSGAPCMARGTLAQAVAMAERMAAVKGNRLAWPLPVFHAVNEDTPAAWDGSLTRGGDWIDRHPE